MHRPYTDHQVWLPGGLCTADTHDGLCTADTHGVTWWWSMYGWHTWWSVYGWLERRCVSCCLEAADSCALNAVCFLTQTEVAAVNSIGQFKIWDVRQSSAEPVRVFVPWVVVSASRWLSMLTLWAMHCPSVMSVLYRPTHTVTSLIHSLHIPPALLTRAQQ